MRHAASSAWPERPPAGGAAERKRESTRPTIAHEVLTDSERGPDSVRISRPVAASEPRPLLPHEARELLLARLSPLAAETVALTSALSGRVVATDVRAAHDLPPFDNSAMDGFAVRAADAGEELPIRGQSYAGDDPARLERTPP